uniref:A disintegrin and metalloproteinase with thrombospondin motifs gon-1-like isoform X5 n=1 Tax=Styela clava TaxID=7725 RepID=UPI0019399EC0|nr:A disintegrin and metalloproteinase with thrombospondin motifs gon-1-like isoform X5 [Styela clava]
MYVPTFARFYLTLTTMLSINCFAKQSATQEVKLPPGVVLIDSQIWGGKPSSPIVGGTISEPNKWPWMVFIRLSGNTQCGGCLISSEWILTAAHCLERHSVEEIVIGSNYNDGSDTNAIVRKLDRKCCHENFDRKSWENDICLVKLSSSVNFTKNVESIDLPRSRSKMSDNSVCTVLGWGLNEHQKLLPGLHEANVAVINLQQCREWYARDMVQIPVTHFCAGNVSGGADTCAGDSGGPLIHKQGDKYILRGITSFGAKVCGVPARPGVYTRVSRYISWIRRKMSQPACMVTEVSWSQWVETCSVTCGDGIKIKRRRCMAEKGRSISTNQCSGRFVDYGSCTEASCETGNRWGAWETKCSVTCGTGIKTQKRKCLDKNNNAVPQISCSAGNDTKIGKCVLPACQTYHWGPWSTICSVTCSVGIKTRTRRCLDQNDNHVSQTLCTPGDDEETGVCDLPACLTFSWTSWTTKCSVTCGNGIETRVRECMDSDRNVADPSECKGEDYVTGQCILPACKTYSWEDWVTKCSVTCGKGVETRTRQCKDSDNKIALASKCHGQSNITTTCALPPCKTYSWGEWVTKCSVTCGEGVETRTRQCIDSDNKTATASKCNGRSNTVATCSLSPCETFSWTAWSTQCSVTCGNGTGTKTRKCVGSNSNVTSNNKCEGKAEAKEECRLTPCIIFFLVYVWGPWDTQCTVTCGEGIRLRTRKCLDKNKNNTSSPWLCLPGEAEDTGTCKLSACPTYRWSSWQSECSVTCGRGIETSSRKCLDSKDNQVSTSYCRGRKTRKKICTQAPCKTYSWGEWVTTCSVTCGEGVETRTRQCIDSDNKAATASKCNGGSNIVTTCSLSSCETFSWTAWSTQCSVTCGNGTETKTRECVGSNGNVTSDNKCEGKAEAKGECKLSPCRTYSWSEWATKCSVTCGEGIETKRRQCVDSNNKTAAQSQCSGKSNITTKCTLSLCKLYLWGPWDTQCTVTCGEGIRLRTRKCLDINKNITSSPWLCLPGEAEDTGTCKLSACPTYSWSSWQSECSVTCGRGIETSSRKCLDSKDDQVFTSYCRGHRTRRKICTQPPCKRYHWGSWDSKCSVTCGSGIRIRSRDCLDENDKIAIRSSFCSPGKNEETGKCDLSPCPVFNWSSWKIQCSVTCGSGIETRTRECLDSNKSVVSTSNCVGKPYEKKTCSIQCITHSWSTWATKCSVTCGKGIEARTRECRDSVGEVVPTSRCSGRSRSWATCTLPRCKRNRDEIDKCILAKCETFNWSSWNTKCSVTCGKGVETRTRNCLNAGNKITSASNCAGKENLKSICSLADCPIYNWGVWTSKCSVTCGNGIDTRTRQCLDSKDKVVKRKECVGRSIRKQRCRLPSCRVYHWSTWTAKCSVTCGKGIETRSRNCLDSKDLIVSATKCVGESRKRYSCTRNECISYNWSVWGSKCSVTCGTGVERRTRKCFDSNKKLVSSVNCVGKATIVGSCTKKACVSYKWGSWKTKCSVTCGKGIEISKRDCLDSNEAPVQESQCGNGSPILRRSCILPACKSEYQWSTWDALCSVTCGTGVETRTRKCLGNRGNDVSASNCVGKSRQLVVCYRPSCQTYKWGPWKSDCSVTCGRGIDSGQRDCLDSKGNSVDSFRCKPGTNRMRGTCNLGACKQLWGVVSDYKWVLVDTSCSVTCGNGQELKLRKCTNSAAETVEARLCSGSKYEVGICSLQACPSKFYSLPSVGSYEWDSWQPWSKCRVGSSGNRFRSSTRYCLKNRQVRFCLL